MMTTFAQDFRDALHQLRIACANHGLPEPALVVDDALRLRLIADCQALMGTALDGAEIEPSFFGFALLRERKA
jgi:hypothetical protein